ncbi:MAG: hypothetical protein HQK83_16015 [Fibrobacteria bacterium]|nr:hypothetical protein [Fibrobacteria bacterium]
MFKLLVVFPFITLLFQACDNIPLQSNTSPALVGCQNCHEFPLQTGKHEYHLLQQGVTCENCHSASIDQTIWEQKVWKLTYKEFNAWDQYQFTPPNVSFVLTEVDTSSYSLCLSEIRGSTLYKARLDSTTAVPVRVPDPKDSLDVRGTKILLFPFDSTYIKMDTLIFGPDPLVVEVNVKVYKEAEHFDHCSHIYEDGTIFKFTSFSFTDSIRTIGSRDSVVEKDEFKRLFIISPFENFSDSLKGILLSPENSFLQKLPSDKRASYTTTFDQSEYMILGIDTTIGAFGTIIDSFYYQFANNTLYRLSPDSLLNYNNAVFSTTSSSHINGELDVNFSHLFESRYQEDTIGVLLDSLSGDTLEYLFNPSGVWEPERAGCWNGGLAVARCHFSSWGWTNWRASDNQTTI